MDDLVTIKIKPANKGLLHAKLGVPKGQNIALTALRAVKGSKSPALRKEANFALNARKWGK